MEGITPREKIKPTAQKGISNELVSELLNPTFDLSIDYSEIYIDDLIENEFLKEIPIIKSIVGIVRTGIAINQFWFAKKLLTFISNFNDGSINQKKLEQFRTKVQSDDKFTKNIAEKLMIHIDRNVELGKTIIISNLFKAYVNENLSYSQFIQILTTLDGLNPKAFEGFLDLERFDLEITSKNHTNCGPRNFEYETLIISGGFATEPGDWFSGFKLTDDGEMLYKYGIKPLNKKL